MRAFIMLGLSSLALSQGLGQASAESAVNETKLTLAIYCSSKGTGTPLSPLDSAFFDEKASHWAGVVGNTSGAGRQHGKALGPGLGTAGLASPEWDRKNINTEQECLHC